MLRVLEDDQKETLKRCLEKLEIKGKGTDFRVVDMWETIRRVVQEVFLEIEITLDPFSLIHDANRCLDEARKKREENLLLISLLPGERKLTLR